MNQQVNINLNFQEAPPPLKTISYLKQVSDGAKDARENAEAGFEEMSESAKGFDEQLLETLESMNDYLRGVDKAQKENKKASFTWVDAAKNVKIFGVNLGDVAEKLEKKREGLKENQKGVGGLTKAWSGFNKVLAASIIGVILLAISSLAAVLTKTQKGIDFARVAMAGFGAVIDVLVGRLISFGSAIISFFSGDFEEAGEQLKKTFSGVGEELIKVTKNALALERALIEVEKAELRLRARRAATNVELKALNLLVEDTTKSYKAREEAAVKAYELEAVLIEQEKANSLRRLAILFGEAEVTEDVLKKIELAKAGIIELGSIGLTESKELDAAGIVEELERLSAAEAASLEVRTTVNNKLNIIRDEQRRKAQEAIEKQKELNKAYEDEIKALEARIRANAAAVLKEREEVASGEERIKLANKRIDIEKKSALAELDILEEKIREKAKKAKKEFTQEQEFIKLRQEVSEQFEREKVRVELAVLGEEFERKAAADKARFEQEKTTQEKIRELRLKGIENDRQIELSKIELIEKSGNKAQAAEQFKQELRLKAEIRALKRQRAIIVEEFGEDSPEVTLIDLGVDNLQKQINDLRKLDLSLLDRIKNKIIESLDISAEELGFIVEQTKFLFGGLTDAITTNTDVQIEQQQRIVDNYDRNIDKLEDRLQGELKLREEGVANDARIVEEQLRNELELRRAAKEKQLELEKKAARQQFAIEATQQASALAVSVANILKDSSKFGLLGIFAAAAGIASMFALFQKYKAQTAKIQQDIPDLRGGGYLDDRGILVGPSHEGGGIALIYKNRVVEAEGGEAVLPKKAVDQYGPEIEQMRLGTYKSDRSKPDVNPSLGIRNLVEKTQKAESKYRQAKANSDYDRTQEMYESAISSYLARIEENTAATKKAIEEQEKIVSLGETKILTKKKTGSRTETRIIKLRQD